MSDSSVIHDMSLYLYLFRCRVFLFTFTFLLSRQVTNCVRPPSTEVERTPVFTYNNFFVI